MVSTPSTRDQLVLLECVGAHSKELDWSEASTVLKQALHTKIAVLVPQHVDTVTTLGHLGNVYVQQHDFPAAVSAYWQVFWVSRAVLSTRCTIRPWFEYFLNIVKRLISLGSAQRDHVYWTPQQKLVTHPYQFAVVLQTLLVGSLLLTIVVIIAQRVERLQPPLETDAGN